MLPKKLKNKKAIAILRVSSHRQENNNSHQVQEEKIRDYCKEFELELVDLRKIVESAKRSDERKKYADAISTALKQGIFNILFYMNDREARNLTDNEQNEHLVMDGKICIHYVNDRKILHKGSSASDFLMRDFYAVQNKNFSRVLSEKVNDVMRQKAENGWFPGNRPTLGYIHLKMRDASGKEMKRGTTIAPDPDERNLRWIRREFELRAKGYTLEQVRDTVLAEGLVPAAKMRSYSVHGVEERLKNKFYWGFFDWQGVEYKGGHELIIPKKTLDLVKASFGIKGKYNRGKYLEGVFSGGWIRCADPACTMQMVYDPKEKKIKATGQVKKFNYYRCSNSRKVHDRLHYVSETKIWDQLENVVNQIYLKDERAKQISDALNELNEKVKMAVHRDIENYQSALDKLDEKRDKFVDLLASSVIDQEEYKRQSERLKDERRYYTELLKQSQCSISDAWKVTAQRVFELAMNAKSLWNQGSVEQRLEILKTVCSNPTLEGASVRYEIRKPFATVAEMAKKEDWRPLRDSNSCLLRERELS